MPASQNKIITKLRERRQIEAELHRMLAANSEPEFRRQAREIASLGSQVIPAIVGNWAKRWATTCCQTWPIPKGQPCPPWRRC